MHMKQKGIKRAEEYRITGIIRPSLTLKPKLKIVPEDFFRLKSVGNFGTSGWQSIFTGLSTAGTIF
jgi:hypothetical protein